MNTVAYGRFSSVGCIGQSSGCAARTVKYIAKSAAKNISSLESHTIVPTLTMFGRVSEWTLPVSKVAVATGVIMARPLPPSSAGSQGVSEPPPDGPAQVGGGGRGHLRVRGLP